MPHILYYNVSVSCARTPIWLTFTADQTIIGPIVGGVVGGGGGLALIIVVIVVVVVVIWKTKSGKGMFLHLLKYTCVLVETTVLKCVYMCPCGDNSLKVCLHVSLWRPQS